MRKIPRQPAGTKTGNGPGPSLCAALSTGQGLKGHLLTLTAFATRETQMGWPENSPLSNLATSMQMGFFFSRTCSSYKLKNAHKRVNCILDDHSVIFKFSLPCAFSNDEYRCPEKKKEGIDSGVPLPHTRQWTPGEVSQSRPARGAQVTRSPPGKEGYLLPTRLAAKMACAVRRPLSTWDIVLHVHNRGPGALICLNVNVNSHTRTSGPLARPWRPLPDSPQDRLNETWGRQGQPHLGHACRAFPELHARALSHPPDPPFSHPWRTWQPPKAEVTPPPKDQSRLRGSTRRTQPSNQSPSGQKRTVVNNAAKEHREAQIFSQHHLVSFG